MKKTANILILLFVLISCRSQTTDTLVYYSQQEVDSILALRTEQIQDLANENTKLLFMLDSLGLVIEGMEEVSSSGSFYKYMADTFYCFVADSNGWFAEIRKTGNQINTGIVKDSLRIASYFGDERRVYFMDGNASSLSVLEDSLNYKVSTEDWEIKLDKK